VPTNRHIGFFWRFIGSRSRVCNDRPLVARRVARGPAFRKMTCRWGSITVTTYGAVQGHRRAHQFRITPAALEPRSRQERFRRRGFGNCLDVSPDYRQSKKGETTGKDCNARVLAARAVIYPARRGASYRASTFYSSSKVAA
jgi:hypothetical protein